MHRNIWIFVLSLTTATLLVSPAAVAQRTASSESETESDSAEQAKPSDTEATQRRQEAMKRKNRVRVVEVKDPTKFIQPGQKTIFSGPQPGEDLAAFQAIGLAGELQDQKFEPLKTFADKPLILIFQDETPGGVRGLLGFSRAMKTLAEKSGKDIQVVSIFLDDDASKIAAFSKRFQNYVKGIATIAVSPDGRDGPGVYGLNRNVAMTILVTKDQKVLHNFVFPQSMIYPDPHVMGAIAEMIDTPKDTVQKWFAEAQPANARMQRRQ